VDTTKLLTLIAAILLTLVALFMFARSRHPAVAGDTRNAPRTALLAGVLFAVAAAINWVLFFTRT
jgi:phosphatidylglycerophosphate synthase